MHLDPRLLANARRLRRDMTPAETILWRELRGRRFAGYKFRRQYPVKPYITDFYCHVCRLVVELDGETHLGREEMDRIRQDFLESRRLQVLRFWNPDVYDDLEAVLHTIYTACVAAGPVCPPHPLAPIAEERGARESPSP